MALNLWVAALPLRANLRTIEPGPFAGSYLGALALAHLIHRYWVALDCVAAPFFGCSWLVFGRSRADFVQLDHAAGATSWSG